MHPAVSYALATWLLLIEGGFTVYSFYSGQYWDAAGYGLATVFIVCRMLKGIEKD